MQNNTQGRIILQTACENLVHHHRWKVTGSVLIHFYLVPLPINVAEMNYKCVPTSLLISPVIGPCEYQSSNVTELKQLIHKTMQGRDHPRNVTKPFSTASVVSEFFRIVTALVTC